MGRRSSRSNEFLVGVSIDGPREIHDTYRVSKGGKATFDQVMRGLDVLKAHEVDWNVLTTMHAANGDQGREVYRFLRDECGATFIQFIPIIERATPRRWRRGRGGPWHRGGPAAVHAEGRAGHRHARSGPEQYGRFLIDVFEEWVRRDIGRGVRADVRHRAGQLGGRTARPVRPRRDVRARARAGAQRRPVLLRSLRRARLPARKHHPNTPCSN